MTGSNSLGVSNEFIILAADCLGISYFKLRRYIEKYAKYNIIVTDYDDFVDYIEATQNINIS